MSGGAWGERPRDEGVGCDRLQRAANLGDLGHRHGGDLSSAIYDFPLAEKSSMAASLLQTSSRRENSRIT
jgi:hypothetical protein